MTLINATKNMRTYLLASVLSLAPLTQGIAKKSAASGKSLNHTSVSTHANTKLKGPSKDTFQAFGAKTKVRLGNGKSSTLAKLFNEANAIAKSIKAPKSRPHPIIDKNGKIIALVKVHAPTNKGPLSGKTIIINAGHGGYNPKNGLFDPGTHAFDSNGKRIEEWYKNQNFTDEIVSALTAKGAKVIFSSGYASSIVQMKLKYPKSHAFISIHCNSTKNKKINGQDVIYKDANDKLLAVSVEKALKKSNYNSKIKADTRGLGVLKTLPKMPSVLIETGFASNSKDLKNIDSKNYRKTFANNLANGLINYFKK